MADTSNDIYNLYKECRECGSCCTLTVINMSLAEAHRIRDYMRENNIEAIDMGPGICPLRGEDMRCKVYPVRSRTCRLHHCEITRNELKKQNPDLVYEGNTQFIDMRRAFIHDDFRDPRTIPVDRIIAHYTG